MSDHRLYPPIGVFLSYASEDVDILQAVNRAFHVVRQQTHQHLEIFFDKKSIAAGDMFGNTIRDALRTSDYLIILYTGTYKRSHSYTGFEVGYFASLMDDEIQVKKESSRRIVSMFIDELPAPTEEVQGIDLTIPIKDLSSNRDIYMERVHANIDNDPLNAFFNDVADQVDKRLSEVGIVDDNTLRRERRERYETIRKIVPELRGEIYDCLSSREMRRSIEQRLIVFELPKGSFRKTDETIPDNAMLTQQGKAWDVFGINTHEDTITWHAFKDAISLRSESTNTSTLLAVERAFVSAVSPKAVRDNEQIIRGFNDNQIYRIIVTRHSEYYDGRKLLYMYLVEALSSYLFGDSEISILLGLINIAAKYRFIFVDEGSELSLYAFQFGRKTPQEIQEKVRQFDRQLLLIEDESRVLKLDSPKAVAVFSAGLAIEDILELQNLWIEGRQILQETTDQILGADPKSDSFTICSQEWVSALKKFSDISHKVNSSVALQALERLKEAFR